MTKVFLSYRRKDTAAIAGRICDGLRTEFGRDSVFIDVDTIPLGVDFREKLAAAVASCEVALVLIGEKWLTSEKDGSCRLSESEDYVRIECETALKRGIPVIPVLIGRAEMPTAAELPETLADLSFRNAIRIDPGCDFHNHLRRLSHGIRVLEHQESTSPAFADRLTDKLRRALRKWPTRRRFTLSAILVAAVAVACAGLRMFAHGNKRPMDSHALEVTDVIVDCYRHDETACLDFRVANRGRTPISVSRIRLQVVAVEWRGIQGPLFPSDNVRVDISHLQEPGMVAEAHVSLAIGVGEVDRFVVNLSAIKMEQFRKWTLLPVIVTSEGEVPASPIVVWLPWDVDRGLEPPR
jgi:hypothetical protein